MNTNTIQIADRTITASEIIPLLSDYQLLGKLRRELIIDRAIESVTITASEAASSSEKFYQQRGLKLAGDRLTWLLQHGLTSQQVKSLTVRQLKIEKFKQLTWGDKLQHYFIRRKQQLDRVVFSIIKTEKLDLAQELYFRLQANEESFADLAQKYSQGSESIVGGFVGPIELGNLPPALVQVLITSQPKKICPMSQGEWQMIIRLEKNIPAKFDDSMRQRLLNELFELWLSKKLA